MKDFEKIFSLLTSKKKYTHYPEKKNLDQEIETQKVEIADQGFEILDTIINKKKETVIVYRELYNDGQDDEIINIGARVITENDIINRDCKIHVHYRERLKTLYIADIKVDRRNANRGYGGILLNALIKLKSSYPEIISITGTVSGVDWDHIDRLTYFYQKYGFEVRLNKEKKEGKILLLNDDVSWVRDEIDNYFNEINFIELD